MIVIDATPGGMLPEAITVVIVETAGIVLAVPAPSVLQVLAPQPVTPLPLVPSYVDGLVGIGGAILPQIDLCRRLGLVTSGSLDAGERLVMFAAEGNFALRVDRVLTLTAMEADTVQVFGDHDISDQLIHEPLVSELVAGQADPVNPGLGAPDRDWDKGACVAGMIAGEFPWRGRMVMLLNPARLGLPALDGLSDPDDTGAAGLGPGNGLMLTSVPPPPPPAEPLESFVLARSGAGILALPVAQVAEVLPMSAITPVPGAPTELVGIAQVRGRPLPVVAPAAITDHRLPVARLSVERGNSASAGVLLALSSRAGRFALRVDAVIGIRRFPRSRIHASTEAEAAVSGQAGYLVDADERLIGLLDADRLTGSGSAAVWCALLPPAESAKQAREQEVPTRQLLVFRVGSEWCGLDVGSVVQLTGYRPPLEIPAAASELAGVIEIGADVLPVVDMRSLRGAPVVVDEWTALIVVQRGEVRWAVVADRIDRLLTVPVSAPHSSQAPVNALVAAVVQVGDRLISVLDLGPLLQGK